MRKAALTKAKTRLTEMKKVLLREIKDDLRQMRLGRALFVGDSPHDIRAGSAACPATRRHIAVVSCRVFSLYA